MAYAQPFSYSYYPKWDEGTPIEDFTEQLLSDYLKEYRKVTYKHRRKRV